MTSHATFTRLAENAGAVNVATTYATEYRKADGTWAIAGDENTDFDAAYDDFAESLKWFADDELRVLATDWDGTVQDVTYDMIEEKERLAELRA